MSEEQLLLNPADMTPDAIIIAKVQAGDKASFAVLYDRYIGPIYRFIYYKTHHIQTAEDITGDVFMKALERVGSYNPNKGEFSTWLYQIARNTIIDHYRRVRHHSDIEDAWDLPADGHVEKDAEYRLLIDKIQRSMERCSPDERTVLMLRLWEGLPHKDIAAIIGKSEDNCKKIYSRALEKIKAALPVTAAILLGFIHAAAILP